jgi:hypothetical protein
MLKIFLILQNFLLLGGCLTSFAGFGYALEGAFGLNSPTEQDRGLALCLRLALGMGAYIVLLQALGMSGYFYNYNILLLTALGLFIFSLKIASSNSLQPKLLVKPSLLMFTLFYIIVFALTKGMILPTAFDEVMYHLPHAKVWAETGTLSVNQGFRYPYFPFNFEILYAACLSLHQEYLTHLLHSTTGILTLIGTYRLAKLKYNQTVAWLASGIVYFSFCGLFRSAYVDLALTFFISYSFYSLYLAYSLANKTYLYPAAFLLGCALGIKYLALIFLPPFALLVLYQERNFLRLTKIGLCLLLPCGFWYLRNAYLVGNPLEPFAASVFGFHSWDALDLSAQMADLKHSQGWPPLMFWPGLGTLLLLKSASKLTKALVALCLYILVVWYCSSHYVRYLMSIFPMMAILSALGLAYLLKLSRLEPVLQLSLDKLLKNSVVAPILILAAALGLSIPILENTAKIKISQEQQTQYLKEKMPDYDVALYLKGHPEYRVYQYGLEDTLYYLPRTTIGDVFGRTRYRTFPDLDAKALALHLKTLGVNALLISEERHGQVLSSKADFNHYFKLVYSSNHSLLYRLI